jgi:ElaB/YqjD/DUF883 family membrane-anchored ribosome-binding protein
MSTVGIVALSVLAALFLFALLGATGLLIWLAWSLKKSLVTQKRENDVVYAETKTLQVTHQAEIRSLLESAKSSFGAIRNESRTQLEDHRKEIRGTIEEFRKELAGVLEDHRKQTQVAIEKINAEQLISVAARLTNVCLRAEKAISVLQAMMVDTEARATHDYGPNEFAPEESPFGAPPSGFSLGQTAAFDEQVLREESPQPVAE